jgi:hypothetical protein
MPKYIGVTKHPLKKRLKQHLLETRHCLKFYWIQSLKKEGLVPKAKILGVVDNSERVSAEMAWIKIFRMMGYPLVNSTDGGEGFSGLKFTEEHKKNLSKANKGQVPWIKGKHHTEESNRKNSKSHMGIRPSDEVKERISKSRSGQPAWNKGIPMTEEAKENLRLKLTGKKQPSEMVEKRRKSMIGNKNRLGKKHPENDKSKISAGLKRFYAEKRERERLEREAQNV